MRTGVIGEEVTKLPCVVWLKLEFSFRSCW